MPIDHDLAGDADSLLEEGYRIDRVARIDGRTSLLWHHGQNGGEHLVMGDCVVRAHA